MQISCGPCDIPSSGIECVWTPPVPTRFLRFIPMGRGRLRGGTGRPEDVLVDIPETRYAPTPDGGYIAYKVIGEGPIDIGHVNAMATNLEVAFEYEPVASFWLE